MMLWLASKYIIISLTKFLLCVHYSVNAVYLKLKVFYKQIDFVLNMALANINRLQNKITWPNDLDILIFHGLSE
jgi:hypothetical protein